jgi:hypothetical protein
VKANLKKNIFTYSVTKEKHTRRKHEDRLKGLPINQNK